MRTSSIKPDTAIKRIRSFYRKQGRVPSYEEMAGLFRFASKRSVFRLIEKLVDAGLIEKDSRGHVSIGHTTFPLPVLGMIPAGIPIDAEEQQLGETYSIGKHLMKHQESAFVLIVKGDSMEEEGIKDGDAVIVDKKLEPRENDVVVASVDGEFTLKYLKKINGEYCLVPGNPKYKTIYPRNELTIDGVVINVIRTYYK